MFIKWLVHPHSSASKSGLTAVTGLTGNLKSASAPMYCLYLAMKDYPYDQITSEEIAVASGNKVLDPGAASEWLCKLECNNTDIQSAFRKQVEAPAVC